MTIPRKARRVTLVVSLLAAGVWFVVSVRQVFWDGLLFGAVREGDTAAINWAIDRGANPNSDFAGGLRGGTPLM
jgi:hypothetical protein